MNFNDRQLNKSLQDLIAQLRLPETFQPIVEQIYLPLSEILNNHANQASGTTFISINGCQGSGKTTLTIFLKTILEKAFGKSAAIISLDDFYLKKNERIALSKKVHPLFVTRGVPGTHDLELMTDTIGQLLEASPVMLPVFDKLMDDRLEKKHWHNQAPAEVVLFEGWCNNSPAQDESALINPVNELERNEDQSAKWRSYANDMLKKYNQNFFNDADIKLMLLAPGFENVFQWRKNQEQKLALDNKESNKKIMNSAELQRFIQHYERITRHSIEHMPEQVADIVIPINDAQQLTEIKVRNGFG